MLKLVFFFNQYNIPLLFSYSASYPVNRIVTGNNHISDPNLADMSSGSLEGEESWWFLLLLAQSTGYKQLNWWLNCFCKQISAAISFSSVINFNHRCVLIFLSKL